MVGIAKGVVPGEDGCKPFRAGPIRPVPDIPEPHTMQPTTSTERIFLRLEQPGYPIDIVWILILAASEEGPLPFEDVRARVADCCRRLPVFRKKLAEAPLGIGEEHWVHLPSIDINDHMRRVQVGEPRDLWALMGLVVELTKDPLDRSRPLWDGHYVEGMADGTTAFILRTHHALLDGMATLQVYAELFDLVPEPIRLEDDDADVDVFRDEPSVLARAAREIPERLATEVSATARLATTAAGAAAGLVRNPVKALTGSLTGLPKRALRLAKAPALPPLTLKPRMPALPRLELPNYLPSATEHPPRTIFNRHVRNPEKIISAVSLPLSEIREVRTATGATVNDILLSLVTATLRSYLAGRGELPDRPLRTTCPVNIRKGGETATSGNHFTTMWVDLPVHLADSKERLAFVHASTTASKKALDRSQESWDVLATFGDMLFPGVVSGAMAFAQTPLFELFPPTLNLTVSTLAAAPVPYYLAGRKVEHIYARMIIHSPVHLFFHSMTYNGSVEFGVTTVKEIVPDVHALTAGLRTELDQLLATIRPREGEATHDASGVQEAALGVPDKDPGAGGDAKFVVNPEAKPRRARRRPQSNTPAETSG